MDLNKIFMKIKELGHVNSKREELREYCKLKIDHILRSLQRRILNNDGGDILDCLFNGLSDNPSCKNTVKIVDIVLTTLRSESSSLTHCRDVISRLCLELQRLPAADLVRWCDDSVQSIVNDTDVNMIWRDVLPECISALSAHSLINHCGTAMTSAQFKQQCVHALCQSRWKEPQLVQLAAMFKDMQLSREDHKQVVNKICSYIIDTPPDTLPPLVHQLLKLCKSYHIEIVLSHLSHYFSVRLYSKLEPPPQDSESTTMDIDDIVPHSPEELSRCLSTCLYHLTQGAAEPDLIRKHIKSWPKTQLLRAPFLLDLALAVSDKGADFRSICLDVIKSAIEMRVTDQLRSKESAWARSVLPPDVDVASVLKVLTTESANHRQLTVVGLINLAFTLLGVSRTRPAAAACWSHGKLVLVRLSKAQPETAPHILAHLADKLAADCTQRQYAECLHVLCALSPVSLERCSALPAILESCQPVGGEYCDAAAVLDAVHPLLNFSARTRDTLVMVCRKGLYSRDCSHRCLAVRGFLSVLRHVKLSRSHASSQGQCSEQYSAISYLTQFDLHATQNGAQVTSRVRNEAMCMEVVSILRRCLGQDATVKQLLYTKLYECAKEKVVLHESILELLLDHLTKFLPERGVDGDSLLLDKCVQSTPLTAVLVEPIAHLLYASAQFLQPCNDAEDDLEDILSSQAADTGSAYLKSQLTNVLDQLAANPRFRLDLENPGLTDLSPESKAKSLKVQQILQCYEALIAHQIMQWSAASDDPANKVYNLFKKCTELLDKTKCQPKLGKKSSKTTLSLNESKETKTQKSQKSQKDKEKGLVKVSNLTKDRTGPFKPLPCLWDLNVCLRVLQLLYNETVSWSTVEHRNTLRSKRDFHQWALRCIQSAVSGCNDKRFARIVAEIAGVLFIRCVSRFQDMCSFDEATTAQCMELFKDCFTFLLSPNYALKMDSFLPTITGLSEVSPSEHIAAILEQFHTALLALEAEPSERVKRLVLTAVAASAPLLEAHLAPTQHTSAVIAKLEEYVRTSRQDCLCLLPALLTASSRETQEAPLLDELLVKLSGAGALGRIDEDDTSADEQSTSFPIIDARTGHSVLSYICTHLGARHKTVEHLLLRARDLAAAEATAVHAHAQRIDRELKELYKCIVIQLCQLSTWTYRVVKLRCCVGGGSDRVLACSVRLYALLSAATRQITPHVAQITRLERLLKLSGKKLSAAMDNLITYLEASQRQQSARGVLRDTKLIPRLVLEAEMFTKHVILLANKGQLNYQQYLSLGTARDFRIKTPALQEALQAHPHAEEVESTLIEEDILSPAASDGGEEIPSDHEQTSPKRKKV